LALFTGLNRHQTRNISVTHPFTVLQDIKPNQNIICTLAGAQVTIITSQYASHDSIQGQALRYNYYTHHLPQYKLQFTLLFFQFPLHISHTTK